MIFIGNSAGLKIITSDQLYMSALEGNLCWFFYFLASLNFLNWIAFVIYGIRRHKQKEKKQLEQTVAAYIHGSLVASMEKTS